MFKILMTGGPCEPYIRKSIDSILSQDIQDFEILIVLCPFDSAHKVVESYSDSRIKLQVNAIKMGAAYGIWSATKLTDIDDDDILVTVDADDWLSKNDSLSIVKSIYDKFPNTLVTHGSWRSSPRGLSGEDCLQPYTRDDFKNIRSAQWKATHLRTMKYKAFKLVEEDNFKDDNGEWFQGATDLCQMFPVLEMAGFDRVKFIPEHIYTYNISGPRAVNSNPSEMASDIKLIRSRKPYELLGV